MDENNELGLIFADGTVIEDGFCMLDGVELICIVKGISMIQSAQIFLDPVKTERITYKTAYESRIYDGFSDCWNIFKDGNGKITAIMRKE